jgi:hypothetical protein
MIFFNEPQKFTGGTPVPQRAERKRKERNMVQNIK